MNEMYLNLVSARLAQEDPVRVFRALKDLGERPRKDGESALLDLGTILGEMNSKPRILSAPSGAQTRMLIENGRQESLFGGAEWPTKR